MAKVALVTGLHGFVGQHLKTALEEQNITVVGLPHDLFYGYEQAFEKAVKTANPEYIFHLASYGNMRQHTQDDDIFSANLLGTYNLLKATSSIGYKAFINVSTSSVMLDYQTMYSATKAGGEFLCEAFANRLDKRIFSVRPFSLYGDGEQQEHLIPRLFRSCLYQEPIKLAPDPRHDFVYVKDFVNAIVDIALNATEYATSPIQIGTGVATSNNKLKELIEQITSRKAKITDEAIPYEYDTKDWKADPGNGYVYFARTSLLKGLQEVYKSYKL